ncbi:O-phosphoseryl-tRNA(Sec) selenium transferase, SepSecS, putative [Angomonas deanei]|uniref:O-phosphoseryl-tRNA(Sec) selenium transferase n=1 Tax=Angomonas deanei TaxID=59799 RepID=A0A7G2CKK0_9TRYP|nr:O-phosphoseryl-tRNA(Sec) selenium transferase, SepSecS, putative [Angomonas deanei]
MNHDTIQYAAGLVEANYLSQGAEHLSQFSTAIKTLFAQRKIPQDGLSPLCIELFLQQLSLMDTNNGANATTNVGAGEREGRVLSQLVKKRHYHFSHGIGRSGDLNVSQPKAAGSSLLYQVCNFLVLHFIQLAGAPSTQSSILFPMATGMTLALVLRTLAKKRNQEYLQHHKNNENNNPSSVVKYVIWPRIDQKTALKCIDVAGLTPVVVEPRPAPFLPDILRQHENENNKQHPFLLQCAVEDIESIILNTIKDPNLIVCVLSTTSCFAPRLPDDIIGISKLCWQYNIPHVVNNAYGLQCRPSIMQKMEYIHHQYRNSLKKMHEAWQKMINKNEKGEMEEAELLKPIKEIKESITNGMRLDVFVQSTDKNLLVPVGGALIASCLPPEILPTSKP